MKNKKNRLIFGVLTGIMMVSYIILSVYGVSNANSLNALYEKSFKDSISVGSSAVDLYGTFLGVESLLKDALNGETEEQVRYAMKQVNDAGTAIQNNFNTISTEDEEKFNKSGGLLQVILEEYQEYDLDKDEAFMLLNEGEVLKCQNHINYVLLPKINAISINLKMFVDAENAEVLEAYVSYKNVAGYIEVQTWVGIVIVILFAVYAILYAIKVSKEVKERQFIEEEEYRITIDTLAEGVFLLDKTFKIVKINRVGEVLTGWLSRDAKGMSIGDVFHVTDESTRDKISLKFEENDPLERAGVLNDKQHLQPIITFNQSFIKDIRGKVTGYVVTFRDITERRRKENEIYKMTYYDQVTMIYNRTYFEESKSKFMNSESYPISVIQGDINGLKFINDAFGHAKGDELLMDAARVLKKHGREQDMICRVGGDEFTIIMPNTESSIVHQMITDVEEEIENMEKTSGEHKFYVSIALGCATSRSDSESLDNIIKRADESMYKKKLLESKSLHSSLLKSIRTTLEEKSHETEAHATRLVGLSYQLGMALGLEKDKLYELELLSNLHDIGKIGIPNQILNKPGPLTDEEWLEMKKHPEIGFRIAQSTAELGGIAQYILCHHERWDGRGYPQGLSGEDIPLLSRVISVVDSFDAMTDDRVYQKGRSKEAALDEIARCTGTQFDPTIAKLFIEIMSK